MTAADEALAEAWQEYMARYGYGTVPTSPDTGADFAAGWTARNAEVESLTAQLQAAQATIAEVRKLSERMHISASRQALLAILSRADTSALAERDKRMKAEGWDEGAGRYMNWDHDRDEVLAKNPYRATSIEQEGADRG